MRAVAAGDVVLAGQLGTYGQTVIIEHGGGDYSVYGSLSQVKVAKGAHHSKSNVVCDALLLDEASRSDTYPYIEIEEEEVSVGHEATVSKVAEEQLFYLQSRGITEADAMTMIGVRVPIGSDRPSFKEMTLTLCSKESF